MTATALPLPGMGADGRVRSKREVVRWYMDRYADDLDLFVREEWKAEPEPWQSEANAAYSRREPYISIHSGHGVGKTTWLAWAIIHHTLFRYHQKTAVTAPTTGQLFDALWPEVAKWIGKLSPALREMLIIKTDRIELVKDPKNSFVSAKTSRAEQPEAMQGVHSDWVLLIADEASGIPEAVFEAASGSMSGHNVMTILTGNPVRSQGYFYDTHYGSNKDMWFKLVVSVFQSRWSGGQLYADQIAKTYGENSNAYRVRVLGLPPKSEDDAVIPFELIEASLNRDVEQARVRAIWGVDVAHMGTDRTTLAKRRGNFLLEQPKSWLKLEAEEIAARIKVEWDATPSDERPIQINVDLIGFGTPVVTALRALGLPARGINVSEAPAINPDIYRNLRTELWFQAREWFQMRNVRLPKSLQREDNMDLLIRELILPTYKFTPQTRKIYLESKEDIKRRGFPSPDLADAFVLTFAGDAITLAQGAHRSNWGRPVARINKTLR